MERRLVMKGERYQNKTGVKYPYMQSDLANFKLQLSDHEISFCLHVPKVYLAPCMYVCSYSINARIHHAVYSVISLSSTCGLARICAWVRY